MAAIIQLDLDIPKMTRQSGCRTIVVVQNKIQIHQRKRRKRLTFISNNFMQNEPNPYLYHPAVLGSRKLATCFLPHLFYSQFSIVKNENSITLNSVSRHDDVEYKDIMT